MRECAAGGRFVRAAPTIAQQHATTHGMPARRLALTAQI
jgi:hypothetical protein